MELPPVRGPLCLLPYMSFTGYAEPVQTCLWHLGLLEFTGFFFLCCYVLMMGASALQV